MIKRYIIGTPFDTESVVKILPVEQGKPEGFSFNEKEKSFKKFITPKTVIYGLGETTRGINKRGHVYRSFCSDDPNHDEDKRSLYAAHNFFMLDDGKTATGYYFDTPGIIEFDMGYTELNTINITLDDLDANIYIISGFSKKDVVKQFRELIGPSYIPPKWAFGYCQSRWSYETSEEVRYVADKYNEAGIPIDSIVLDIDYMEAYKDFTINREAFPDFEELVAKLKENKIHLVPIIDAGVKVEEGYDVYEEGVRNNFFVKKEDGSDLVAAVWPGRSHLPDFLNAEARAWFGNKYKILLDKGIDGFWNDMNEPAIFYTKDHLEEVFEEIEEYKGKNLDISSFFSFVGLVNSISNSPKDYRSFYHNCDGVKVNHEKVHNLYGYNMTRAAAEAFDALSPDKRILMYSRSSYIGMHRYAGIWTGDNKSWWGHLLLNIQQLPGLSMCGFLYAGADMGGFGGNCTKDLMLRWIAVSMFTPLFRNHACRGTRRQELYEFGDMKDFKELIRLRYALIPYLYSEFLKAAKKNEMYISPLSFEYEDDRVNEIEDQLLVGESIMIAPVYRQNATGRYVYLPEDMKLIRFRGAKNYDEEILEKGDHYVKADINEVLVFIRPGHELVLADPALRVEDIDYSTIRTISYKAEKKYELLNDDGISK